MLDQIGPQLFFDLDVEKARDSSHLSRQVGFKIIEMHEQDVGQVPRVPPSLIVFPERSAQR